MNNGRWIRLCALASGACIIMHYIYGEEWCRTSWGSVRVQYQPKISSSGSELRVRPAARDLRRQFTSWPRG
jgi:hypothetical protein